MWQFRGDHDLQNHFFGQSVEFTALDSTQKNGKVERKFATLYGRVQAMLNED
jgi:hypothetical protein